MSLLVRFQRRPHLAWVRMPHRRQELSCRLQATGALADCEGCDVLRKLSYAGELFLGLHNWRWGEGRGGTAPHPRS